MMSSTASVQVCLDAGRDDASAMGFRRRWALAHALGPVLVAAFANSPLRLGRASGWRSTRQAVWHQLDPGRTRPPVGADPREAWARYALDAAVMCIRDDAARWTVPEGLSFRQWIRTGLPRRPTLDDLAYHLGTLFPPVRPRGYLELRMIDAQAGDAWAIPVAVTAALFGDAHAADEALAATEPVHAGREPYASGPWLRAARLGLRDPVLARAALNCFLAAYAALGRQNVSRPVRDAVAWFIEAYVARGRSPADDVLDTVDEFA
jgi:glutamate--cysteine ligase